MKKVYGYLRVSTAKQGEGVSLVVQKEAIIRYAAQYSLEIVKWFEEKETAAKQGRPLFMQMMHLLRLRKAHGVVIHKIDRSARNLKDWADLGGLIDQGVEVHFAHESLDLNARGGRLSADIQAVIAADYIRNLRQEALKGLYGRLEQGIYPFQAPVGYVNNGKGKCKTIHPTQGPLVKKAFELYATKNYSLKTLRDCMHHMGLRNLKLNKLNINGISLILNNPFYAGILEIKGTRYNGQHEALIDMSLFQRVQDILYKRDNQKTIKHDFLFKRIIKCQHCQHSLTGERQKGHVYYRCHTKGCITKGIRESKIEDFVLREFSVAQLRSEESVKIQELLDQMQKDWKVINRQLEEAVKLEKSKVQVKLERLTDCYVEGGLDKETYEQRKGKLLIELKGKEEIERKLANDNDWVIKKVQKFFELAKDLVKSYENGNSQEKRELVEIVTSNLSGEGKMLIISMRIPYSILSQRHVFSFGAPRREIVSTMNSENASVGINEIQEPLSDSQLKSLVEYIMEIFKSTAHDDAVRISLDDP